MTTTSNRKPALLAVVLHRLVRRWFVPRKQYDETVEALRAARSLIIRHHECGVVQSAGCFCPVCHRSDGTEPEIDAIYAALHKAPNDGDKPRANEN